MSLGLDGLKTSFQEGQIDFPTESAFKPWADYKDGWEESVFTLYHPFQILEVLNFRKWFNVSIPPEVAVQGTDFPKARKQLADYTGALAKRLRDSRPTLVKLIGFLIVLHARLTSGFASDKTIVKLTKRWGVTLPELKQWYEQIASDGHMIDPL